MVGGDVNGVGFGFRTVMSDVGNIVEGSLSDSRGDDGGHCPFPLFQTLFIEYKFDLNHSNGNQINEMCHVYKIECVLFLS